MTAKGHDLPQAKLNPDLVRQMRHAHEQFLYWQKRGSVTALAKEYRVDRTTVRRALDGDNWGHVND